MMSRRRWIQGTVFAALAPSLAFARAAVNTEALLRRGGAGLVVLMRHATAPGTFDPPGFVLGECSTQRNLDDEGRAQARAIGAWYRARGLVPAAVRSSQWCRCVETASLAFGAAQPWPSLNSVIGESAPRALQTAALRTELARRAAVNALGFEVWVTHQVNISELTGEVTGSGDAVLVRHETRPGGGAGPAVLASLTMLSAR
jgi:phosphohistidine phosphatase SixA